MDSFIIEVQLETQKTLRINMKNMADIISTAKDPHSLSVADLCVNYCVAPKRIFLNVILWILLQSCIPTVSEIFESVDVGLPNEIKFKTKSHWGGISWSACVIAI